MASLKFAVLVVFGLPLIYTVTSAPSKKAKILNYVSVLESKIADIDTASYDLHKKYNATYFKKNDVWAQFYLTTFKLNIVEMAKKNYTAQDKHGKTVEVYLSRLAKLNYAFLYPTRLIIQDEKQAGGKLSNDLEYFYHDKLNYAFFLVRKLKKELTGKPYLLKDLPDITKQMLDKIVIGLKNRTLHSQNYFSSPVNTIRNWRVLYEISRALVPTLRLEFSKLKGALKSMNI